MKKELREETEPLRRHSGVGEVWQLKSGWKIHTSVAEFSIAFTW